MKQFTYEDQSSGINPQPYSDLLDNLISYALLKQTEEFRYFILSLLDRSILSQSKNRRIICVNYFSYRTPMDKEVAFIDLTLNGVLDASFRVGYNTSPFLNPAMEDSHILSLFNNILYD